MNAWLDKHQTIFIFGAALLLTVVTVRAAVLSPRDYLINEPNDSFIPPFVILFSVIGALMYFFASTVSEWIDKKEDLKNDEFALKNFNEMTFFDKLKTFDLGRKILRVIAAPPMAIGVYLLFDLIFFNLSVTNEQQISNISLMNATIQDLVNGIENANNAEKLIEIKAGISFLVGAFVKQFLDIIKSLTKKITNL